MISVESRQKNEGNVRAGIRTALGDDKIADFTVGNHTALMLKHPQRDIVLFWKPPM